MRRTIDITAGIIALALALAIGWQALPLEAQGNVLKVVGLRSTGVIQSVSATIDAADDLTMSPPTLPPNGMTTSAVSGSCLNTRQYRFKKAWVNQSGFTTIGPASSPDFTPSPTSRRVTINFADEAPPAKATAVALFYMSSQDSFATTRSCGVTIASSYVAAGTTTFDCACQGVSNQTGGTTSILTRLRMWYQGEIRAAQEATDTPKTATVDKNRLRLTSPVPEWSPDSGVTYGRLAAVGVRVKTVCNAGCDHTTLTAALAAITDASITNPYVIDFDGIETTGITMKSWVSITGKGRWYSQTGPLTYATDVTGTTVSGVTISGNIPIGSAVQTSGSTRPINRVEDVNCGLPLANADCLASGFAGDDYRDWVFSRVTMRHQWDTVIVGKGARFWDFDCKWEGLSSTNNHQRGWNWEQASMLGVEIRSYNADFNEVLQNNGDDFIGLNVDENTGTPDRGTIVELHNPSFTVNVTAPSWTGFATCVKIHRAVASSFQSRVLVQGMTCRMFAGSTGTLTGIETTLDASDHATWRAAVIDGEIELTSTGATKNDIVNNETVAGFLSVSGVRTGGAFSGAGVIEAVQTHRGAFDTLLQFPPEADLVADTCRIGELKADNGGATRELCWCYNNAGAGRWACVSATITNGPFN